MKKIKNVLLWISVGFFLLVALAFMPSVSSFVALAVAVIIAPVEKWQDVLRAFVKGKMKTVISVVLVIVVFITAPTIPTEEPNDKTVSATAPITTQTVATESATANEVEITTESNTTDITENISAETTEVAVSKENAITTQAATVKPTDAVDTTAHVHSFAAATCTSPKTCTSCGATSGSAPGHNYSDGTCSRCGANDPNYVKEEMVWISGNGSKYHSNPNCSNMKNPSQVSKSQAEADGRGPCSNCY